MEPSLELGACNETKAYWAQNRPLETFTTFILDVQHKVFRGVKVFQPS